MLSRPGEAENTLAHHRRILDALCAGDAERAREAMAAHLDTAWDSTRHALRAEPDDERDTDANEEAP